MGFLTLGILGFLGGLEPGGRRARCSAFAAFLAARMASFSSRLPFLPLPFPIVVVLGLCVDGDAEKLNEVCEVRKLFWRCGR